MSPGLGIQKHWYPAAGSKKKSNPLLKFLLSIRPSDKLDDLEVLTQINDKQHFKDLARKHGWSEDEIRKFFD